MSEGFSVADYGGFVLAWSDDWPGLVAGATAPSKLESAVPLALAEHTAWLNAHGEDGPGGSGWHLTETISGAATTVAGGEFCFSADREPLPPQAFERAARHVRLAAKGLAASAALPDALLDWMPPGLKLEHTDPWAPDPRTIRGILTHALQLEVYYRDGLRDGTATGIFGAVRTPQEELDATLAVLQLAAREPGRSYAPVRPSRTEPDAWTLRKVIRRLISHHRAHTAEILQRRTWVLLGVPATD